MTNLLGAKGASSLDLGKIGDLGVIRSETGWDVKFYDQGADVDSGILAVTGDFANPATLRAASPYLMDCFVFHGNTQLFNGAISHGGDDTTGAGDRRAPDEVITVNTNRLPDFVRTRDGQNNPLSGLLFSLNIHDGERKRQEFDEIREVFWRLVGQRGELLALRDIDDELYGQRSGFVGGLQRDMLTGSWRAVVVNLTSTTEVANGLLQRLGITGR